MARFICISVDPEEQQFFIDQILADSEDHAAAYLVDALRPYATDVEVYSEGAWRDMADRLLSATDDEIKADMDDLACEAEKAAGLA